MSKVPAYLEIAAALRAQIAAGDLRPGAPVPSTRALAREWKVALATAAHALRTLASEGVVEGVPRYGTIVARTRSRTARAANDSGHEPARAALTRERIVAAAMLIADREGLASVSLRGVAAKLDASVMSLYRHVKSKEELFRALVDVALGESVLPESPPPGWRAQLELVARREWAAFRQHPWLARVMSISRPEPLASSIAYAEWMLRALDGHGLDAVTRMQMHITLFGFVQGIAVNLETEAEARGDTGMTDDEWMQTRLPDFAALAASGRFPFFAAVLRELDPGFDLSFDDLFELGLRALLDGFAHVIDDSVARRAPRGSQAKRKRQTQTRSPAGGAR